MSNNLKKGATRLKISTIAGGCLFEKHRLGVDASDIDSASKLLAQYI